MAFNPTDILTGKILSGGSDSKAEDYLNQATGAYNGITPPTLDPIELQKYAWLQSLQPQTVQQGADVQYDPATAGQAQTAQEGPSAMEGVSTDPRLKDQQMSSLGALNDLAQHGGMNATDQANLARIQSSTAAADQGRRDAITQNMAARGMGGGGNELLAKLQSNQAATDRQAQQGLDVAGMAQQRALQAMTQGGQLAGQVRGQDFGEQSQKAQAQDAVSRFNASNANNMNQFNTGQSNSMNQFNANNTLRNAQANRQTNLGVQQYNAGQQNAANRFNIEGQQGTSNANVDMGNKQTMYNQVQRPQQQFQNQMGVAAGKAGVAQAGVAYNQHQSQQERGALGNLVGGGAQMFASSGYGKKLMSGEDDGGDEGDENTPAGAHGGFVPGRASVLGDSPRNDTVKAILSPGEVVLPRSAVAHAPVAVRHFLRDITDHPIGSQSMKPEDLGDFLQGLRPRTASLAQPATDDDLSSKLAALGLLKGK